MLSVNTPTPLHVKQTPKPLYDADLSTRMFRAHTQLESQEGRRISQAEVAATVSTVLGRTVDQTTIGRWMRGVQTPDVQNFAALAIVYGVSVCWLTFGEGAMERSPDARPRVPLQFGEPGEVVTEIKSRRKPRPITGLAQRPTVRPSAQRKRKSG
jgi:hypothetical protein